MSPDEVYDVLIIGAGLAGTTAGFHLARDGYRVAIIEREQNPHHKVCGEYLTPETFPYLQEMGIDLDKLEAAKINGLALHSPHFSSHMILQERAFGLSRYVLDEECLMQAVSAGCQVFRGTRADNFDKISAKAPFLVTTSQGNFQANALFLATGKHEIRKINVRHGRENSAVGFKMHLTLNEDARAKLGQDVALFFYRGGYAGLSAIEEGVVNLCFIVDRALCKKTGNSFESVIQVLENKKLQDMLVGATHLWQKPLTMAGVPYGYLFDPRESSQQQTGLFFLGDQCAVIPSLTGSGMAIALFTGKLAAQYYHAQRELGSPAYTQKCIQTIRSRMRLAYPLHALTRFPLWADITLVLLKTFPGLARFFLSQTRMPTFP